MVVVFNGGSYVQSCWLLETEEGEAGRGAWAALSPEQRHSTLQLVDILQASWEGFVREDNDLLLEHSFQVGNLLLSDPAHTELIACNVFRHSC